MQDSLDADLKPERNKSNPIVIGGVGGSGTRMVAGLLQSFDVNLGDALNESLNILWFTLLFRRPSWKTAKPSVLER